MSPKYSPALRISSPKPAPPLIGNNLQFIDIIPMFFSSIY